MSGEPSTKNPATTMPPLSEEDIGRIARAIQSQREFDRILDGVEDPPTKNRHAHVAKPEEFDGHDYEKFMQSITLYVMANRHDFQMDIDRILFVLSYMKEGTANLWAKNYIEECLTNGDTEPTWETFKKSLEESFQDPNKQATAQNDLTNCRMKKGETAEAFFNRFDILRRTAGYTKDHDAYLIQLVEQAVPEALIGHIYRSGKLPKDYEDWKRVIVQLDKLDRRWKERKGFHASFQPATRPTPRPAAPTPAPSHQVDRRDATGVTYGGKGQPMDVSMDRARREGLCYYCGAPDHIKRNCPKRKAQIRMVIRRMDLEERQDWLTSLHSVKEDDVLEEEETVNQQEDFVASQQ